MQPLPIDSLLPEAVASLRRRPSLVVEAPPGAGKTTRLPPALLDAGLAGGRDILVLEPRRIAARMSARRVAEERGEAVGESVGYQIRFEEVAGPRTRLRFMTEGVLTRRLLADGTLEGVGAVVLDEFHERHLQADLALALLKRLQLTSRPDLLIVAMSATLDAEPLARYLDDCPRLRSEGRRYDVAIEHAARHDERPLELQVESALRRLLSEGLDGDCLVFLPGASSIRRAREACASVAAEHDLLVLPLHGSLPADEQDAALRPADRRKLILSTNVAETSITIDGVAAVVDSGLVRVASHSPWSGLPVMNVERVSRASAEQRAGRAGRTREGRCIRLYTERDLHARPSHETPEVRRLDLSEAVLELHAAGVRDTRAFEWFEPPPVESLEAAESLLHSLGAIAKDGEVTPLGRRMLRLPLHPRLARVVLEADARGVGRAACTIAALIGERDIRAGVRMFDRRAGERASPSMHGASDLLLLLDLFEDAARSGFDQDALRRMNLNANIVRAVDRVRIQLQNSLSGARGRDVEGSAHEPKGSKRSRRERAHLLTDEQERELLFSILAGYPDRVARRRTSAHASSVNELLLSGGGSAQLAPDSVVREAEFLVAVDAEENRRGEGGMRGAKTLVRAASAIEPDWLIDLFADSLSERTEAMWNAEQERVEIVRRLFYDRLLIDDWRVEKDDDERASQLLAEKAATAGPDAFVDGDALESFLARVEFLSRSFPEMRYPVLDDVASVECLAEMCAGRSSFTELRDAARGGELFELMRRRLTPEQRALLATGAPERVALARGRQARVHYERGQTPWVASRLQDFFGMREGPSIACGRVPLVLHLLAPNQRPVQVTKDLAGFWERHYPSVRRELSRRYPRHAWPDDPIRAT